MTQEKTQAVAPNINNKDIFMGVWEAVKRPPPSALKQIKGGRLTGMTDINPQWRYQAMTEQFGICGFGWKYQIIRVWSEPATDGQVFAFAEIALFTKGGEGWNDAIPGIGGSLLIAKESGGLHPSDEAYKMAITDALSVAMKMLGVAADVYAGLWDGSKYKDGAPPLSKNKEQVPKQTGEKPQPLDVNQVIRDASAMVRSGAKTKTELQAMLVLLGAKGNSLNSAIKSLDEASLRTFNSAIKSLDEASLRTFARNIEQHDEELAQEEIPF